MTTRRGIAVGPRRRRHPALQRAAAESLDAFDEVPLRIQFGGERRRAVEKFEVARRRSRH